MEDLVIKIGFGLCYFFCLCMFVIGSQFMWGVVVGLCVVLFGAYFREP